MTKTFPLKYPIASQSPILTALIVADMSAGHSFDILNLDHWKLPFGLAQGGESLDVAQDREPVERSIEPFGICYLVLGILNIFFPQAILEVRTWFIKRMTTRGIVPSFARLVHDAQQYRLVVIGRLSAGKIFEILHNRLDNFLGPVGIRSRQRLEQTLLTVSFAL